VAFKDHPVHQAVKEIEALLVFRVTQVLKDSPDHLEVQAFKDHPDQSDQLAPEVFLVTNVNVDSTLGPYDTIRYDRIYLPALKS